MNFEDNHSHLITQEDLFKVLKKKHHAKLSAVSGGQKIIKGVFYETVCMLESIELVLQKIYERTYPTREDFREAKSKKDQKRVGEIISFYWLLCIDRKLLKYAEETYCFSEKVTYFLVQARKYEGEVPFWIAEDQWSQISFPEQAVFDFIEEFVSKLEKIDREDNFSQRHSECLELEAKLDQCTETEQRKEKKLTVDNQNHCRGLVLDHFNKYDQAVRQFNTLLDKHRQLSIFVFDINLIPQEKWIGRNPRALEIKKTFVQSFTHLLSPDYGLVAAYSRLEIGINYCLNQQVILLFKVNRNFAIDPRRIKAEIDVIMRNRMGADDHFGTQNFSIQVRDFRDLIVSFDKKFPKKNIIKAGSSLARQKFEYWVLGYFCLVDLYLRPDLASITDSPYIDQHQLEGVVFEILDLEETGVELAIHQDQIVHQNLRKENQLENLRWYDQDESILRIRNLPKTVEKELKQVVLLYSEYSTLFDWKEKQLKLLFLIEYLMRFIQHNPIESFTSPYVTLEEIQINPHRYLSYVAKLFVAIHQMMEKHLFDYSEIKENSLLGWRVKEFYGLYESFRNIKNNLLGNLHVYLRKIKHACNSKHENQSLYSVEKLAVSKAKKNALEAGKYLNQIIKNDVFALRFEFSYLQNKNSPFQEGVEVFNSLFTDFLKNLKRAEKLSKAELLAHIGTRFLKDERLYVDITFIFDAKCFIHNDDLDNEKFIAKVEHNVMCSWQNYIAIKQEKIKAYANKKYAIKADSLPNQGSEPEALKFRTVNHVIRKLEIRPLKMLCPNQHIKYHDKKSLRAFKDRVINFYTSHTLLCTWKPALQTFIDRGVEKDVALINMEQFLKGRIIPIKKVSEKTCKKKQTAYDIPNHDHINKNNLDECCKEQLSLIRYDEKYENIETNNDLTQSELVNKEGPSMRELQQKNIQYILENLKTGR